VLTPPAVRVVFTRHHATAMTVSLALHVLLVAMLVARSGVKRVEALPAVAAAAEATEPADVVPDAVLPVTPLAPADDTFDVTMLRVDQFTFDIAKIRSRANSLFPFLTLDLMFLDRVPRDVGESHRRMVNPLSAGSTGRQAPPLDLPDDALRAAIDRAWSRRKRWQSFAEMVRMLSTHHPSAGRAADLVRGYLDQNILQPYCDGTNRDLRFWAMLENAADHADFVDFVRSYARRYPSSKTTSELLFLLDELLQGSRDVVLMLLDTRPEEHLQHTRVVAPEGYTLALALKERYGRWLFERGWSKPEVWQHYNQLRLRLLSTIIDTSPDGYRVADARFLGGQVLFEMNRIDDAVRAWGNIAPVAADAYARAYGEILDEIESGPVDLNAIRRILSNEHGRWRLFSIDRLKQFGHHCDTF
jgi:hypothetical protein